MIGISALGRRVGFTALATVTTVLTLTLAPGAARPASATMAARVALPDPTPLGALSGTPAPLASAPQLTLRVYLAGQRGRAAAASAVSDPRSPEYGHYLTATQFRDRYGATAAQGGAVARWLTAQGMTVTATTPRYVAVTATPAEVDAAFDTTVIQHDFPPITVRGRQYPSQPEIGTTGGFSVPAVLGDDIAAVTGLQFTALPVPPPTTASPTTPPPTTSTTTSPTTTTSPAAVRPTVTPAPDSYLCSRYWGQHTEQIPAAYGRTSAPTQLCGYTPAQLRAAYGVGASRYTGKGVTVAIVMTDSSPTMLSDANEFFTSHGVAGFAPGQFTVSVPASVAASCTASAGSQLSQDEPGGFDVNTLEEAIDVESVHITAPAAKVVYAEAGCEDDPFGGMQALLDSAARVVDQHLANVVSGSFSDDESLYSAADGTAWNLTFEQGAIEGIGFDLSSGDGGPNLSPPVQTAPSVSFPSSSPWVTSVGGTALEIGRNGTAVADYPWNDNATQEDSAGTGYISPPPGEYLGGSTGGRSVFFAEPGYQRTTVPAALATGEFTGGGDGTARRVVPDISANAEGDELIGYTGAVTSGVYGEALGGGTSEAAPLFAGLEADAVQAAGHPLGFLDPALYLLHDSAAISDVLPVNPADPPVVIGTQLGLGDEDDYLTTLGEDPSPLRATKGYDDETGLGAPGSSFVTAISGLHSR